MRVREDKSERALHRLLTWQLRLLPLAILGLGVLLVVSILLGRITPLRAAAAMLAGIPLGLILSQVQRIRWSDETERIIASIDALGIVMLLVFWTLMGLRTRWLVGVTDSMLETAAIIMATATGILMTRLWHLQQSIRRVLRVLKRAIMSLLI